MNKKLFLIPIIFFFLFMLIYQANASCIVQGYVKNATGNYLTYNVSAYCQTDNSWRNITGGEGVLYYVSWGGPVDNCQSFCDNVYITGINTTLSFVGYPTNETTLVYYYPMNSSNTGGWSGGSAHNINITQLGDITAPTITIISPTSLFYYNTQSIWFNVTTNELTSWCGYSLDGASNVTITNSTGNWNHLDSSVAEGTRSVQFYCNDSVGNVGTASRTFYVDITNPLASFGTNPADGSTQVSSTIVFDAKCIDNMGLSHLQIWSNKTGAWALTTSQIPPTNNTFYNLSTSGWSDGYYKWGVRCNDSATNSDWTDTNRTFSILTLTMDVTIISPTSGFYYNLNDIWFNVSTSQTASWCGYSLDGASNVSLGGSGTFWYTLNDSMTEGSHSVRAYCNNSGGTVFSDGPLTFYVDLTNPVAYTNNPLENSTWTSSNIVTFNLKCIDNLGADTLVLWGNWSGTWQVEQTNSGPTNNTWWNPTETIANGVYLWAAWCEDNSGRTNMTENITFMVNYHASPGGGGGGGSSCSDLNGVCYDLICPAGSTSLSGTCNSGQVCCTPSYCPIAKTFITQYSMLGFSALDFDGFCALNPSLNKTTLKETVNNYVTKCGTYCFFFELPFVGKYFEMVGRIFSKTYACIAFIIFLLVLIIAIIWLVVANKKKKRRRY